MILYGFLGHVNQFNIVVTLIQWMLYYETRAFKKIEIVYIN